MSATIAMPAHFSPASKKLTAEMWVSLVSLLRSHVAMYSVARPGVSIKISGDNRAATLLGPAGTLIVTAPDASGACAMEFRSASLEANGKPIAFFFDEGGLIRFEDSGFGLDLEAAVEQWLGKVLA